MSAERSNLGLFAGTEDSSIYYRDHSIHADSLSQQCEELIQPLDAYSIVSGQTIAVSTNCSWFILLMLHVSSEMGITLFPLDPRLPPHLRDDLLQQAGVDLLLSYSAPPSVRIDSQFLKISPLPHRTLPNRVHSEVALILATSGSSGAAKAVMLERDALYQSALAVNERLDLRADDCWLNCLPLYHIGGLSIPLRTMLTGASMLLQQGFKPKKVWQDLHRYPVTHLSLVPTMLAQLLDESHQRPLPKSVRTVLIGGEALNLQLAERALAQGWPLFVTYGMSETCSQVALNRWSSSTSSQTMPLLPGMECSVVNDAGEVIDGIGHIRVRGKMLMRGFANPNHQSGDGIGVNGWYDTGDMGRYSATNGVEIVGRAGRVFKSGGEKVHPRQVEQLIAHHPNIQEFCVIGISDPVWGERVALCYTGNVNKEALERWCRERIDGALRPRLFFHLERLPLLANGKIDHQQLHQSLEPSPNTVRRTSGIATGL